MRDTVWYELGPKMKSLILSQDTVAAVTIINEPYWYLLVQWNALFDTIS